MKKYLLPLILILFLLSSVIGYADLFGTYDQRIKLTTDHTKVDDTLTDFPVTAFFTAAQAEEVFAEFDADEDFDRGQFALGDDTLLYADKELFDDSESLAIYHFKVPSVSSSAGTDVYFYYDNDVGHNTTYISASGDIAAQSVWDSNFKGVYHKSNASFDILNACDLITNWSALRSTISIDTADKHGGIGSLKVVTTDSNGVAIYDLSGTWNWSSKTYLRIWIKGDTADTGKLWIYDSNENYEYWSFTAPTTWILMEFDLSSPSGDDGTGCGDFSDIDYIRIGMDAAGKTVRFDEIRIYPSTNINIIDSTFNGYHGTKKGVNEPVEVAGKLGQAQDYERDSKHYITIGSAARLIPQTDITVTMIVKPETVTDASIHNSLYVQNDVDSGSVEHYFYIDRATGKLTYDNYTPAGGQVLANTALTASVWEYIGFTRDTDTVVFYKGVSPDGGGTADTCNVTANIDNTLLGARYYSGVGQHPFDGIMDEVRISDVARSAAWMKAEYNSLWDTLLTYGDEETEEAPTVNSIFFGTNF